MAAAEAEDLLDLLFEKLHAQIVNEQHKRALKTADEILRLAPGDIDALRCKVAAHIQLGDFDAASAMLAKQPLASQPLAFEKAYCQYRQGRVDEALATVRGVPDELAAARLQLEAQLHFRLGHSKECIQLYDELFQKHKVDSLELKTNVVAAYVAASLASEIPAIMSAMKISSKQSFELGFNKACGLAEAGDFAGAENELRMAIKLGRETLLDEDCAEAEVEDELAPLTTQLAYVLGRLGRGAEAQELYDTLLRGTLELSDEAARTVAANNVVADNAGSRLDGSSTNKKFLASSTKKFEMMVERGNGLKFTPSLEGRLSSAQKLTLHLNRALLYLTAGVARKEQAATLAAALSAAHGDDPRVTLLAAALVAKDGKRAEADKLLDSYSQRCPSSSLYPTLMRVQLALEASQPQAALSLLASVRHPSVAASGALVATQVGLLEQLGDSAGAESILESSLASWSSHSRQSSAAAAISWCLQALVTLKLKMGKVADATALYSKLAAVHGGGAAASAALAGTLAKLARAVAALDPGGALALEPQAAAVPADALRGINLDVLEESTRGMSANKRETGPRKRAAVASDMDVDQPVKVKKHRKHKPKYPAGYDPALPIGGLPQPDPERWLPKWQRASAQKKKSQRQREKDAGVKGSQGAGKVDESLDRTKAADVSKADSKAGISKLPTLPARKGKGRK